MIGNVDYFVWSCLWHWLSRVSSFTAFKNHLKTLLYLTANSMYLLLTLFKLLVSQVVMFLICICLSGIQALLSVLDKFRVENRRNMFVIKETKSAAIFYIRFHRISITTSYYSVSFAFSALTLLVGRQEGHPACKNWAVGCWCGYLSGVRCKLAYSPADATATHCLLL